MSAGDAGGPSDKGASGSGAGIPSGGDTGNIEALVNEAVSKAIGARMKRLNVEEQVSKAVEAALAKLNTAEKPEKVEPSNPAESTERVTTKALDEKYRVLQSKFEASEKARQDAETRATQTRLRADVESAFAAKLGADSPHIKPYVNSLIDQFDHKDGQTVRKVKDQYGDDVVVPLSQGIDELFKADLKHLVSQSKAAHLPPNSAARGQAIQGQRPGAQQTQPATRPNPIHEALRQHFTNSGEHGMAAAFDTPGIPQK